MTDKIGDPLANAAATGTLGQRKTLTSVAKPAEQSQASSQEQPGQEKEERVKRTLMFTPERAKWLKVQAALEGREMSDIVEEALATYQQLHPRTQM